MAKDYIYKVRDYEAFDKPINGWKSLPSYRKSSLDFRFTWAGIGMNGVRKILTEWKAHDPSIHVFDLCKVAKPHISCAFDEKDAEGYHLEEMWVVFRFSKKDAAILFKLSNTTDFS